MRKYAAIAIMALVLAGCGSREPTASAVVPETRPKVVEKTLPTPGTDTTLPAPGAVPGTAAATPEALALAEANKAVPPEKRMAMAVLLECEEAKIPGGVTVADRPAFVRQMLERLNADPLAAINCRAGANNSSQ